MDVEVGRAPSFEDDVEPPGVDILADDKRRQARDAVGSQRRIAQRVAVVRTHPGVDGHGNVAAVLAQ